MWEEPVPVFAVPWRRLLVGATLAVLLGLAAALALRLVQLQDRVHDLERRLARLEAPR
jgi:hypothetical protein